MRKTLTYSTFVVASLAVILIFITAKSYTQLGVAVVLYPLLAYFAFRVFPHKAWRAPVVTVRLPKVSHKIETEATGAKGENVAIADIDKRAFLKLIGGIGLSAIIFSIIGKRAGGLFSGGTGATAETVALKNIAGNKIDPVEKSPTDGYRITEVDDAVITFFGFTNKDGAWYIMRQDTDTGTFRYARGTSNFPGSWANREHIKYDYYNKVFK